MEAKLEEDFGDRGATFILEDGTHCYMPSKYQNKAINLSDKKYHSLTIEEVYENSKNFQVLVSNDSPQQVRELLKNEIPEIADSTIQIVGISRVKGERAKISFRQNPEFNGQIDVLGSIIGPNSSRINRIHQLSDEKIDVILYSDNIIEYISNALSPAKIISVNKKTQGNNGFLVVVPNSHNTLAIGRKGLNVKLAVELISVNIDICSYSYALEHKIPINWNGNIKNEEELLAVEEQAIKNNNEPRRARNQRKTQSNKNGFFIDFDEFEKEIAEYNSEISTYEPLSNTDQISPNEFDEVLSQELKNHQEEIDNHQENFNKKVANKKDINIANANFKFDKDIAGDIDFSDYDFSDFDDEDF